MGYPIKQLIDEYNEPFLPFTNSQSIGVSGGKVLQEVLDVKLDPADVKAGSNIKVTPGTDNTTIDWVRPTNLTVQNNVTTTSSGKGVLDAYQGKVLNDKFANYIPASQRGVANGVATLDDKGIILSTQLPAYVDDVIEAYIRSGQTALSSGWLSTTNGGSALTPETGKIYVIMTAGDYQNKQYRWGGSVYVLCNPSDVNSVNGMTGVITLKTLTVKTAEGKANAVNETFNAGTDKTVTINVPSKTSHITNDSGFITSSANITGNAATATTADKTKGTLTIKMKNYDNNTETTDTFNGNADKTITIGVPTKVSQLENDSKFITSSASITGNAATATTATTATKTQGTLTIKMKNYDSNTETTDTFNGNADKTITIGVPTKLSQLSNDTGFITSVPQASATVSGTVKIGTGLAINSNGVVYVTGEGVTADEVDWDKINGKPTHLEAFSNENTQYITASDSITGNAKTATTLQTGRTINGTTFDGSKNITTANWGTARNISIADSDATNTSTAVSVNGSAAVTLKLPATIKATLSGNASSASKLATKRTITLTGSVTGSGEFDGSGNLSITTTTAHSHNYAGSSSAGGAATTALECSGNAATASTLKTARTLTIGSTGKTFNGSANVSWTLAEIGAAAASHSHNILTYVDTRDTNPNPNTYSIGGIQPEFKNASKIGLPSGTSTYAGVLTYQQWTDTTNWSGGSITQFATVDDGRMYFRKGNGSGWANWYQFYTTAHKPTASDIGAAASSHTHNYAGSASAGGAANSVKTSLAIKLNGGTTEGTNLFTFNGSTAKTVNITASGIGAAASSHTHNYAGSSSAGGAANSTKASLTLTKNGGNTVFNGGTAYTVTIPTIHTGTGVPASSLGQNGDIYIVTG